MGPKLVPNETEVCETHRLRERSRLSDPWRACVQHSVGSWPKYLIGFRGSGFQSSKLCAGQFISVSGSKRGKWYHRWAWMNVKGQCCLSSMLHPRNPRAGPCLAGASHSPSGCHNTFVALSLCFFVPLFLEFSISSVQDKMRAYLPRPLCAYSLALSTHLYVHKC
jgi:hypothetical protein